MLINPTTFLKIDAPSYCNVWLPGLLLLLQTAIISCIYNNETIFLSILTTTSKSCLLHSFHNVVVFSNKIASYCFCHLTITDFPSIQHLATSQPATESTTKQQPKQWHCLFVQYRWACHEFHDHSSTSISKVTERLKLLIPRNSMSVS